MGRAMFAMLVPTEARKTGKLRTPIKYLWRGGLDMVIVCNFKWT
jgi:hypothetical protein